MDSLELYRDTIEQVLRKHADIPYSLDKIDEYLIVDRDRNHFLLLDVGWQQKRRVHGCLIAVSWVVRVALPRDSEHVQIIDGKIWIQRDGIEDGITEELVEAGIPKSDIVLGFHPPEVRHYTGYAIA